MKRKKKFNTLAKRKSGRSKKGLLLDLGIKAKKSGRRKSKSGKIYYETRPNRSDLLPFNL